MEKEGQHVRSTTQDSGTIMEEEQQQVRSTPPGPRIIMKEQKTRCSDQHPRAMEEEEVRGTPQHPRRKTESAKSEVGSWSLERCVNGERKR
jgi:hypothetical protein